MLNLYVYTATAVLCIVNSNNVREHFFERNLVAELLRVKHDVLSHRGLSFLHRIKISQHCSRVVITARDNY